jgi:hypothetical protein
MQGHGYASQPHLVAFIRSVYSNNETGLGRSIIQSIYTNMPADETTSYDGVVAQQNAKVHAGHNYNNVTNSRRQAQHMIWVVVMLTRFHRLPKPSCYQPRSTCLDCHSAAENRTGANRESGAQTVL